MSCFKQHQRAVTVATHKQSHKRYDVSCTTLFSSNRIHICTGLLPTVCAIATAAFLPTAVGPLTVLSLNCCRYAHRYEQTEVISDLNHEWKRGSYVPFAVYFKQETITIWRRISDFCYHNEQQQQQRHPFPYHYKILPWNCTADYKTFTTITGCVVALPNTTKDKLTLKIFPRTLWVISNAQTMCNDQKKQKSQTRCQLLQIALTEWLLLLPFGTESFVFLSHVWEFEG